MMQEEDVNRDEERIFRTPMKHLRLKLILLLGDPR
jgi:hypothetical protein